MARKAIPKGIRQRVYKKYNGHCGYCGCEIAYNEMQVDHIVSVYWHEGANEENNYMPACRMCNFYKSTSTIEEFRKKIQTIKDRLEKVYIYRLAKKYGIIKESEKAIIFYFEREKEG